MSFDYIIEETFVLNSSWDIKSFHMRPVRIISDNFELPQGQKSGQKSIKTGQRMVNKAI